MKLDFYNTQNQNRDLILCILQMTTLYNVMQKGWKVTKINNNTFELTKKISQIKNFDINSFDLELFIDDITNNINNSIIC
jgi:hypothetical protein